MSLDIIRDKFDCFKDPNFKFEPKWHKYTYNGVKYISVTQILKNFHKPFEKEYWSKKKAEEAGIEQEVLLKEWQDKTDYANLVGTFTHDWIENYFNKKWKCLPDNIDIIDRINKFNKIFATSLYKLEPLLFEVRVFSKKYPIAGTIDSIFLYQGNLFIIDWKTNGDFKDDDHPKGKFEKLLYPFEDFYKNHLNEYSIQVSLYSLILEEWGIDIKGAYIVHFGPTEDAKIYKSLDMRTKLREYLDTFKF